MNILAGTSKGVFSLKGKASQHLLESQEVRDLVRIGDVFFAGTGSGVFLSTDNGKSWLCTGLEDREVWQIRGGEIGSRIYAVTQPAELYCSDNGGQTWQQIETFSQLPQAAEWCLPLTPPQPGRARALVIDQNNPLEIWVGVEVGGIAHTKDGGETWDFSLPGKNPDLHMMCAQPDESDVLYASTGYGRLDGVAEMVEGNAGVFRSDDSGKTWDYAWKGITPRYSRPMCIDARSPHGLTVACAPTAFSSFKDEGGAKAMLLRSEDRGMSWRSLCDTAHSPCAANIHALTPDVERVGGVVIGTDTGEVWRVSNDGRWELLGEQLPSVLSAITYQ